MDVDVPEGDKNPKCHSTMHKGNCRYGWIQKDPKGCDRCDLRDFAGALDMAYGQVPPIYVLRAQIWVVVWVKKQG